MIKIWTVWVLIFAEIGYGAYSKHYLSERWFYLNIFQLKPSVSRYIQNIILAKILECTPPQDYLNHKNSSMSYKSSKCLLLCLFITPNKGCYTQLTLLMIKDSITINHIFDGELTEKQIDQNASLFFADIWLTRNKTPSVVALRNYFRYLES